MPTLDVRPGRLVLYLRPGNAHTFNIVWPDALTGRTFEADLDGEALQVVVVDDTVTVTFTADDTTAVTDDSLWKLTETTAGDQVRIVGRVLPSLKGTDSQDSTVNVTVDESTLVVTVLGEPGTAGAAASTEAIQDIVGAMVIAGTGVTVTYNDTAGTLTIEATGGGGGLTQEQAEDIVAALIDDNSDLDWTYDDATASLVAVIKPGAVTNAMLAGGIALSKLATDVATQAELDAHVADTTPHTAATELTVDDDEHPWVIEVGNPGFLGGLAGDPTLEGLQIHPADSIPGDLSSFIVDSDAFGNGRVVGFMSTDPDGTNYISLIASRNFQGSPDGAHAHLEMEAIDTGGTGSSFAYNELSLFALPDEMRSYQIWRTNDAVVTLSTNEVPSNPALDFAFFRIQIPAAQAAATAPIQVVDSDTLPIFQVGVTGYIEQKEQSDPAAPSANYLRIYAKDDGAGVTRLYTRSTTGVRQIVDSADIGATPGGELGGTWASPTVDATHSGSTHAATQAAAEATAAADATTKANAAQAAAVQRANHTGSQAISTVTSLQTSLDLKAPLASPTFTGDVVVPDANAATEAMNQQTSDARYVARATEPVVIGIACSDETTALTTGTAKATFRMPHAMTLTAVRASLTGASSSGTPTVDINEGAGAGTTILSTKLTIDASELTSTTAAAAAVISDTALADDAQITIDIDVAGTAATGLKVWLIGTRAV